ncbi:MAG: hypothetical protein ACREMY_08685 [bacterium]
MARIIYLRPVDEVEPGRWRDRGELDDAALKATIQRAEQAGYSVESSMLQKPPYTDRIRLGGGGQRDYLATMRD